MSDPGTDVGGIADRQAVREEYDRMAADYDRQWRPYIDATLQAVVDKLRLDGHERVLDVAAGTGELERRLLAEWPELRVTGVDLSPGMLQEARRKDVHARVGWIEADAARLPFSDESFDCVICANSFHYFGKQRASLYEFRRVLRPKGRLMLLDWCDDYLACKLCSWWLRWTDSAFQRTHTLKRCRAMLEDAGFEVLDARRFRVGWLWGLMQFGCCTVP